MAVAMVDVNGLRKVYAGRPVVDGVSFAVEEGEIFGILGPNGAGKTTTVECVEGLRTPDGGTVRVAGLDPVADHDEITRILGAQLQESELQAKLTVREALELYSSFYRAPADWRLLGERLGLTAHLDARFEKLSGGQKQRLFIALALIGNPRIVVLDELTAGLDPRGRRDTWSLIEDVRDAGVTVLLVTHFMEEAQRLCDRVAVIDRGRLVALDTPSELIRHAANATLISFTPSRPVGHGTLGALPGAASVTEKAGRITIGGTDETVNAVIALLVREDITAERLRVVDATLDDAFLDLTGRRREPGPAGPADGSVTSGSAAASEGAQ
ncbi:ABC transporter ATP-binding protein [Streptomyces albus]|uniref:ABC transporter ATP-binding protein n=1 Tax=Streptomyces albus TaxID=1888 RepID=UPI0014288C8D|nr:ABC transporter ATP-binding protein [Streptomyces albus]